MDESIREVPADVNNAVDIDSAVFFAIINEL